MCLLSINCVAGFMRMLNCRQGLNPKLNPTPNITASLCTVIRVYERLRWAGQSVAGVGVFEPCACSTSFVILIVFRGGCLKNTAINKYHMISLICGILKNGTNEPIYKTCVFWNRGTDVEGKLMVQFSSVQSLSRVWLFATPWLTAHQASLPITNSWSSLRLTSIESVMPSSHLILCHPLLLLPPIPPSISLFQWVNSSHEVAKVLEFQLQRHSLQRNPRADLLQNGLVGCPCSPRDSKGSSPKSQFKSINSLVFSLLHSPTLTSIHDHWKNHSLDKTDLCWQSNVSAFEYAI